LFCWVGFECSSYFRCGIFSSGFEEEKMSIHNKQPNRQRIEMTGAQRSVIPMSPRSRYTVFAILLGVGVTAEVVGAVMALIGGRVGLASLFIVTVLLFGAGCILEMRKLSKEF
jgi:hypothetical protein